MEMPVFTIGGTGWLFQRCSIAGCFCQWTYDPGAELGHLHMAGIWHCDLTDT